LIRPYRGVVPRIAASAYIDSSAQIIGDVTVGERSSVWLNVSIRGDVNYIRVGDETSIQDNCVLHVDHDVYPCLVGNRVTVGHSVVLHGCQVEDDALIGIGAIVLNGAKIGAGAVVAAGALVPEGMEVPAQTLVMGTPAKVRRAVTSEEQQRFRKNCENYVKITAIYKDEQP
jgi:gamma-carbonic anhydrase